MNNRYHMLSGLGQGSQARVKLAIKVNNEGVDSIDWEHYIPEYYAVKVYVKPYLIKQRSFNRSNSTSS